jgi:hypothetical protein
MGFYGAAVSAEKNRGLALGYYIARSEHGAPSPFMASNLGLPAGAFSPKGQWRNRLLQC